LENSTKLNTRKEITMMGNHCGKNTTMLQKASLL